MLLPGLNIAIFVNVIYLFHLVTTAIVSVMCSACDSKPRASAIVSAAPGERGDGDKGNGGVSATAPRTHSNTNDGERAH